MPGYLSHGSRLAILVLALATPVVAIDGQIEINQTAALAGSVTPGDTPGFPVTLSLPGRYRLTGNLDLSVAADPPNTSAIALASPHIDLDLNGFEIRGTVSCSRDGVSGVVTCTTSGVGSGVTATAPSDHARVHDGSVRGMGNRGVDLSALSHAAVEQLRSQQNGNNGISVGSYGEVSRCAVSLNGGDGINAGNYSRLVGNRAHENNLAGVKSVSSLIESNVAVRNRFEGIISGASTIRSNEVLENKGDGIFADFNALIIQNLARANGGDGIDCDPQFGSGNCSLVENSVAINGGVGLKMSADSAYRGNQSHSNTGLERSGGVDAGGNVCDGVSPCP